MASPSKNISFCAVFTVVGLLLSYVEGVIPINLVLPLPGFKLGLANLAVLYTFFVLGFSYACAVCLCRITLSALLFGSVTSFLFSLAGGALTLLVLLLYKVFLNKFCGMIGLCVLCAAMHNIGQCLVCAGFFGHYVLLSYLPYLLIFSLVTGSITGFLSAQYPRLKLLSKRS